MCSALWSQRDMGDRPFKKQANQLVWFVLVMNAISLPVPPYCWETSPPSAHTGRCASLCLCAHTLSTETLKNSQFSFTDANMICTQFTGVWHVWVLCCPRMDGAEHLPLYLCLPVCVYMSKWDYCNPAWPETRGNPNAVYFIPCYCHCCAFSASSSLTWGARWCRGLRCIFKNISWDIKPVIKYITLG